MHGVYGFTNYNEPGQPGHFDSSASDNNMQLPLIIMQVALVGVMPYIEKQLATRNTGPYRAVGPPQEEL